MLGNQSTGKDAGKPQRVEFGKARLDIKPHGRNCAQAHGYSLHANTRVGELARGDLEKLLRYVCRPAIAAHRLELLIRACRDARAMAAQRGLKQASAG